MDIKQLGIQLGEYLYDCGVDIDQVQAITGIVEQIRLCAYEQGRNDMQGFFFAALGRAAARLFLDEHAAGIITKNYDWVFGEPKEG